MHNDSRHAPQRLALLAMLAAARACFAAESLEFVAEHLPESAMDNRYATLPLWNAVAEPAGNWQFAVQGGASQSGSGALRQTGSLLSVAAARRLDARWSLRAFGFGDALRFSGAGGQRPLEVQFVTPPLALPAAALFSDLRGRYRNLGAGFALTRMDDGWPGAREWAVGALWQRVALRDYQAGYRVLDGPSRGAVGTADYSGNYAHFTLIAGVALPRNFGDWRVVPHAQMALPLPRRGIQGRLSGPGFDLRGDTAAVGNGRHFGDFSLTFGLDLAYQPWGVAVDVGTFATQAVLEHVAHKGVDRNWVLSVTRQF